MPIVQSLEDLDATFKALTKPPIIINDLPNSTTEDRERLINLINTTFTSDMVASLPSCQCGQTKGEFSRHVVCDNCHTPVTSTIEGTLEHLVWFRKPNGVERLINPIVLIMLTQRFTKSRFALIHWLIDTTYKVDQNRRPKYLDQIEAAGISRGYNYFVQNFFSIMDFLLNHKEFRVKAKQRDTLAEFLKHHRDLIFSDYIPLMNKSLLIIEKNSLATYIDNTVPISRDPIEMMVSIDKDFYDQTSMVKQNRTARALVMLTNFYNTYLRDIVSKKTGIARHYVGGSRLDYSARAVISSITDPHRYDEIEVPWGVGLTIFRPMLVNKLIKKSNMIPNEAVGFILSHIGIYNELLDKYLKEILAECPDGRYPVIFNRFPSLLQGSIQLVYIGKIKTNPRDFTIGTSILICTAYNADFDGDAMSIYLALDRKMEKLWYPLSPKFNIFGMDEPLKINKNISIPKPVVANIGLYLQEEEDMFPE